MMSEKNFPMFPYFHSDYSQIDRRKTSEINYEMNLMQLSLLGYNYEESVKYLRKNLNSKL